MFCSLTIVVLFVIVLFSDGRHGLRKRTLRLLVIIVLFTNIVVLFVMYCFIR